MIALGFLQTTVMEIGQPPALQEAPPAVWVKSRQYTGRIVTISNDKIFDEPVYNFTRDFPFLWEEISIPIPYTADRELAERIMLESAERYTIELRDPSRTAWQELERYYTVHPAVLDPETFVRITENALEITVRFVVPETGIRTIKDLISRDILDGFKQSGIEIGAPNQIELMGFPKQNVQASNRSHPRESSVSRSSSS